MAGRYAVALDLLGPLATQGAGEAQAIIAEMFQKGAGVGMDVERAAYWTQLAADAGVVLAQFNLGVMYEHGIGIPKSIERALDWYRLAAQWGSSDAQINLSRCFHLGLGVGQDESMAAWWMGLAADQGDLDAQSNLGLRFQRGIGVEANVYEALLWFSRAASAGSDDAAQLREKLLQALTSEARREAFAHIGGDSWKPKPSNESASEVFKSAARDTVEEIRRQLGEERFQNLRIIDRDIPSTGELILKETRGIHLSAIAADLGNRLAETNRQLRNTFGLGHLIFNWILRLDDLADVGAVFGQRTAELTHDVLEFHLALIGEIQGNDTTDLVDSLLKRFAIKQTLRAQRILPYSRLDKTLLPIRPWSNLEVSLCAIA